VAPANVSRLKSGLKNAAALCKLRHLILDGKDEKGASIVHVRVSGDATLVGTFRDMIELVVDHFHLDGE
jgi:hypothetical protein